ncbi:hypothetical protein KEM52_001389, partial [Ascosphaera acerosa]
SASRDRDAAAPGNATGPAATTTPQFLFWSEKLLGKVATLTSKAVPITITLPSPSPSPSPSRGFHPVSPAQAAPCLAAFRAWAAHSEVKKQDPASPPSLKPLFGSADSPAATWRAYYDLLTAVVASKTSTQSGREVPYTPPFDGPPGLQLLAEFRRVQGVTEVMVLAGTAFPKAHETNDLVEAFVEQVVANWRALCGPRWERYVFGGGDTSSCGHAQEALTRGVLELLYRAAAKTFHSLLILRRLFHVHASLGEFRLATKALDTYITLHTRAKQKAQKHPEMDSTESTGAFARTVAARAVACAT